MPFGVRRQVCTNSAGERGSYVVYRLDTGAKVSCHKSRTAAEAARRIRTANSRDRAVRDEDLILLCKDLGMKTFLKLLDNVEFQSCDCENTRNVEIKILDELSDGIQVRKCGER